jgi:hypothetical protein
MAAFVTLRTFSISFVLAGALIASAAAQGWKTYTFANDGFSIDLPAPPDISTGNLNGPIVTNRQYQVEVGISGYVVGATRCSLEAKLDQWNDNSMVELADAMKGGCRMRDGKPVSFAGALSYEMVLDRCPDGIVMKVRMYVVGDWLYQLVAAGPTGVETKPEAQRFHDSFRLIQSRQPPPDLEQYVLKRKRDSAQESHRLRAERRTSFQHRLKKPRGSKHSSRTRRHLRIMPAVGYSEESEQENRAAARALPASQYGQLRGPSRCAGISRRAGGTSHALVRWPAREEPPAQPVACNSALLFLPKGRVLDSFSHFPHINTRLVHIYRV